MPEEKDYFRFKQFKLLNDGSAFKVGTDGVLLGAWVSLKNAKHLLDIGTGSGLIALQLAQRTKGTASILAIEADEASAITARHNMQQSPWADVIQVHHESIQGFKTEQKFDLVVSNPPFFRAGTRPPLKSREQARHTIGLSHSDLLDAAIQLTGNNGRLAIILPYEEGLQFILEAKAQNLYLNRLCEVKGKENKPIERLMMEFSTSQSSIEKEALTIYKGDNTYTDEYLALTRDFYLFIP